MKKYLIVFVLVLCLPIINAASYFNKDKETALFWQEEHFIVRSVKADRAMDGPEREDHWQIFYSFDVDITNFEMKWEALDGTNDMDTREYTDKRDDREANEHYDIKHSNFPTYVDNMKMVVRYTYNGEAYEHIFFIYSIGDSDHGSNDLAINSTTIPDEYQDTDGTGAFDGGSSITGAVSTVFDMVKAPYNLLKWLTSENTIIMLIFGFIMVYVSTMLLIKFNSAGAEIGAFITLILGIMIMASTILEGIGAIGI